MTDAILWAIFVLLVLALVLQVITARRGPWERPMKPCVPVQCPDEDEVVIEGFYTTVVGIEPRALRESLRRWEGISADTFPVEPARTYPLEEIQRTAGPLLGHPVEEYGRGHVRIVQDEVLEDPRWS